MIEDIERGGSKEALLKKKSFESSTSTVFGGGEGEDASAAPTSSSDLSSPVSLHFLKWSSFIFLILQASGHAIVAKYSRIQPGPHYLASTVVFTCEVIKLVVCIAAHYKLRPRSPDQSFLKLLYLDVFGPDSDWMAMSVTAICYFIQNLLLFVAIQYLDPATYQITSQFKILTTAMFSVLILGTHLPPSKWVCLLLILGGVCLVQLQTQDAKDSKNAAASNSTIGFLAVLARCTLSGFAGIWFEKALKGKKNVSIFLRNIQLSLFSLIPGFFFAICIMDGRAIIEDGWFQGYTGWTYLAIFFESAGGLIVAMVVKYADSILKVIATTLAFLLSSGAAIYLFDIHLGSYFLVGSAIVMAASQIYIFGVPSLSFFSSLSSTLTDFKKVESAKE